ncbi:hypothetical protein YYC_00227 [Plasmodium yoelii 17X]|uniref:PYST-C1-like N-terminal domain-containing protein n=1 Tax=Plasmodium yoelii 17X TaxID=1323249 RepID=V7PXW3_PLAYE|nr:hypothetical protein YYC_00227 [Plasmodium yoelii 17X]
MKTILLALISSIIFSIVLAEDSEPEESSTDEFDPMLIEIYKIRKTKLDEPFISETDDTIIDEVIGFLRRK